MRGLCTGDKVRAFMELLARSAQSPGTVYLTGGASAVLIGWRESTVDVDLKFDPEPEGVFEAIPAIKEQLDINVELASPDMFVPPAQGWKSRSEAIATYGNVEFKHFDFVSQALAKIERGHERDLGDVRAMLERGLLKAEELTKHFALVKTELLRYPSIDPEVFEEKLQSFLKEFTA